MRASVQEKNANELSFVDDDIKLVQFLSDETMCRFLIFFPKDDISGCIKVNRDDMCMCAREGGCERVRR